MADIRIHREHQLGLEAARQVAWRWAEEVEGRYDMACTVIEGDFSDTVEFTRPGVNGRLVVAADHFDLEAKLGLLIGAFSKTIEREIQKTLDDLLAGSPPKAAVKTAAKGAAKAPAKAPANASANATAKAPAKKAPRR